MTYGSERECATYYTTASHNGIRMLLFCSQKSSVSVPQTLPPVTVPPHVWAVLLGLPVTVSEDNDWVWDWDSCQVWISVMYCASCDLIISVIDIDAVAGWTVGTELELAADEDILATKNLNLFSACWGTVSGSTHSLRLHWSHWWMVVSCLFWLNEESITLNSPS